MNEGAISRTSRSSDDGTQGIIRITLKYLPGKEKAIQGLPPRLSPACAFTQAQTSCPKSSRGWGIAIISTSRGVMTDKGSSQA